MKSGFSLQHKTCFNNGFFFFYSNAFTCDNVLFQTRIMVTHGIHWLPLVDSIIVLIDGKITEMGTYDELLGHDGAFAQFLKTYLTQENPDEEEDEESKPNFHQL